MLGTVSDAAFQALAEPRRRDILRLVRDRPRSVNEIAEQFDVSQQAISQHLKVLKDAGLVAVRPDGQRRLYMVRPEGLAALQDFLAEFWPPAPAAPQAGGGVRRWPLSRSPPPCISTPHPSGCMSTSPDRRPSSPGWATTPCSKPSLAAGSTVDIKGAPVRGRFLHLDPPHLLLISWGYAGSDRLPPGASTVEIRLTADRGGTRVELQHRDLPPAERPGHISGWTHYIARLQVAAAGRDPGPDPGMPDASPAEGTP